MIDPRVLLKLPLEFQEGIYVYPPSVKDVLSEPKFGIYRSLLCITDEDIEENLLKQNPDIHQFFTPLEYILALCCNSQEIQKVVKDGFKFFIHLPVTFLYNSKAILIGDAEKVVANMKSVSDIVMLTNENFTNFQNLLRTSMGDPSIEKNKDDQETNPFVKRMKAIARYRDRVKAKQKKGSNNISIEGSLESLCCMDMGLNPLNIGDISFASINPLIERYRKKEKYHIDLDSLMAGAKSSKVHLKDWILDD